MKWLVFIFFCIFIVSCTANNKSEALLKCDQFVHGTSDITWLNPLQVTEKFNFSNFQGDSINEGLRLIGTFENSDTIKVLTFTTIQNSDFVKVVLDHIIVANGEFHPNGKLVSSGLLKLNNKISDSIDIISSFILTLNSQVRIDTIPDVLSYEKGFYSFGTHGNLLIIEYKCGSNYKVLFYPNLDDNIELLNNELKSIGTLLDLVNEKFNLDLLHSAPPKFLK